MTQRNWLGNTGAWSDPAQWDTGLPGTADNAAFGPTGTFAVNFATTATLIAFSGGSSAATLDIASGLMDLTGLGGNSSWGGLISQTGGTLVVASGSMRLNGALNQTGGGISVGLGAHLVLPGGTAIFAGALTGMGELDIGGSATINTTALSIGAMVDGIGGTLTLGGNETYDGSFNASGSLAPDGNTLTLGGRSALTAGGRVSSAGALAVTGSADINGLIMDSIGGVLVDAGTITQDSNFTVGQNGTDSNTVEVSAGATYDILTDTPIAASNGGVVDSGTIVNSGLFEKTVGTAGTFTDVMAVLDSTGTVRSALGTLLLQGPGSVLGGTIDGAGTLSIGSTVTLAVGAVMNVATTVIGFGAALWLANSPSPNSFVTTGEMELTHSGAIVMGANSLTLQGLGVLDGTIDAPGSLFIAGRYDFNGLTTTNGTLDLQDQGVVTQSGPVMLGVTGSDQVTFGIDEGAVYDLIAAPGISTNDNINSFNNGTTTDASIANAGLFEATANGGGAVSVNAPFTNTVTGTILVAKGAVAWTRGLLNDGSGTIAGAASIAGGLTGTGSLTLEAGSILTIAGTVSAGETITFAHGATNAELVLASPGMFAGTINQFAAAETIELPGLVADELTNAIFSYGLSEVFNGVTTAPASLAVANPPGSVFLTEDGAGGRKLLATSPGTVFPGQSVSPNPGHAVNTWVPMDGAARSWFTAADWSNLGIPDEHQAAVVGEPVPFDLTFAGGGAGAGGPVDMLTANTNTTLQLSSGELSVLEGGTFSGNVEQTGGVFDSVSGHLFNGLTYAQGSTGFLESDSGILNFAGETVTLGGTVYGGGVLEISGGGTLVPVPGVALGVREIDVVGGGTLVPFAGETLSATVLMTAGNMPLFASSVTFAGRAALAVTVALTTSGTIVVAGTADDSGLVMNGTSGELLVQGEVVQTANNINLNSTSDLLSIAAGATYDVEGDVNPFGGRIVNAGLFEKTGGSGQTHVEGPFSSTGEVAVNSGTLWLDSGSVDLAGTVSGSGTLLGNGGDVMTLEAGLLVNVGTLAAAGVALAGNQSYGGVFSTNGNVVLQGHSLTLLGHAELTGTITGPGVVDAAGSADLTALTIQGNGATFNAAGTVTQSANVTLGNSGTDQITLTIATGHSYNILVDGFITGIVGTLVTGTIANAGLLEKTAAGGNTSITADVVNTGTLLVQHGTMTLNSASTNDDRMLVAGSMVVNAPLGADTGQTGTIEMTPTGTLVANAPIAASQTIVYDPGGLIAISQIGSFSAAIASFTPGDTIDLVNTLANRESYTNGVLTMTETSGPLINPVGTLAIPGLANPAGITLANDGNSGTFIVEAPCFAAGTRIDTARGPVAVEHLHIGDLVMTARGEAQPVLWLGHRRVDCRRHPRPWDVLPVRVRAGAFGEGRPRHDLLLSPDHAVFCDGVLIPVRYLINDATIVQEAVGAITYWHVELVRHDVLLAEGLPSESYLDTGNRSAFTNGGGATELHPGFASDPWDTLACARLVTGGPTLERVRAALLGRAAVLGHDMTDEADPRLLAGRWTLRGRGGGDGVLRFTLPQHTREVRLRSLSAVPAHVQSAACDHRVLGVAVARLWLDDVELSLTDARLGAGWHEPERGLRWTDGDAAIATGGARRLCVQALPLLPYWRERRRRRLAA